MITVRPRAVYIYTSGSRENNDHGEDDRTTHAQFGAMMDDDDDGDDSSRASI